MVKVKFWKGGDEPKTAVEDGIVQLKPGAMVSKWKIDKKLGEGGFGAVYKVTNSNGEKFAMKVESSKEDVQILKLEVFVLMELGKAGNRHFCKIEDKGIYKNINYVVMTLVGKCLSDLSHAGPNGHMSLGCSISIGIQALEALEDLHNVGYLHRDVKPANYTIGRPELKELRKVYILDFGMCRKFTHETGIIKKPRQAAGFRGTVRYAPISCHIQKELCRRDDLETWMYMQAELTCGRLPWQNLSDMTIVGEQKQAVRSSLAKLFPSPCPKEFIEIMKMVDALKYYDTPNYGAIYGLLRQSFVTTKTKEYAPYDWENDGPAAGVLK